MNQIFATLPLDPRHTPALYSFTGIIHFKYIFGKYFHLHSQVFYVYNHFYYIFGSKFIEFSDVIQSFFSFSVILDCFFIYIYLYIIYNFSGKKIENFSPVVLNDMEFESYRFQGKKWTNYRGCLLRFSCLVWETPQKYEGKHTYKKTDKKCYNQ